MAFAAGSVGASASAPDGDAFGHDPSGQVVAALRAFGVMVNIACRVGLDDEDLVFGPFRSGYVFVGYQSHHSFGLEARVFEGILKDLQHLTIVHLFDSGFNLIVLIGCRKHMGGEDLALLLF